MGQWVTVQQFAELSGLTVASVQEYVRVKKILSEKKGPTRLIPLAELNKYIDQKCAKLKAAEKVAERQRANLDKLLKQKSR